MCKYSYSTIIVQSKVNEAKQSKKFDAEIANSCEKRAANTSKLTSETHVKWICSLLFRFEAEKKVKPAHPNAESSQCRMKSPSAESFPLSCTNKELC